jgi:phage I-like protein
LIFKFGENRATQNGKPEVVYLTPKGAKNIVAEWKRRRIAGAFDYEHAVAGSAAEKAKGVPAAGWFSLAVRADGLWAVGITWLESALKYFKAKEYRYFSPYFSVNRKGEIVDIFNVALTNWPATDQQRPLIALSWATRRYTMEPLSIEQLQAKATELIALVTDPQSPEVFMSVVTWLDKFQRGEASAAEPLLEETPAGEVVLEESAEAAQVITQAAYTTFKTRDTREVVASLKQFNVIVGERNKAVTELRAIKHTQAVEEALKARKITPAQREQALRDDPDEFRVAMKYANPVLDTETLTAKTRTTTAKTATPEEALNDDMRAYCASLGYDEASTKLFAQNWAKDFGAEPFRK